MYLNKFVSLAPSVVGDQDVSTGSVLLYWIAPVSMLFKEAQAMVTAGISSASPVVVTFFKRPTHGSTVGEVSLAVLTIPASTAVGLSIYKDLAFDGNSAVIQAGQEVVVKLTAAASTSGRMQFNFVADEDPEVVLNQPNLVASA